MTKNVGKYNPMKVAYYENKKAREQVDNSAYDTLKEWAKTNSPRLYQKLEREDREMAAWDARLDAYEFAHLDDPAALAQWYELEALVDSVMAKKHENEYALLGIEPGATKRDVKNAYRRQARKLHPDKGGDPEAFKQMYAAYRKLLTIVKE